MSNLFNMPDEVAHGFSRSAKDFLNALAGIPASAAVAPAVLQEAGSRYWGQQWALWTNMLNLQPAGSEACRDQRFRADEWTSNTWYSLLRQSYLANGGLLEDMIGATGYDEREKHRLRFFMRQLIDAASPTNYAATNPEAIRMAIESNGESLRTGMTNLIGDLARGTITITDEAAFEVGENVAVSKGAVVFENALFQLIQYVPLGTHVAKRPLLIVPPCINKFYILDLQPENSFVRFAVEQGQTVFMVSWRNPDAQTAHTTWDDYLESGVMEAIDVALAITGADKVNTVGWCVGGTILSSALAVIRAREEEKVASLTLLTTMLDFTDPGDLGVFIDEQTVLQRERAIGSGGIYPGRELGFVFQMLRANDLIWPNVINNYLKGKSPAAFDLLYWNADSTNLPGPMYTWYLRNMYLENNLRVPGKLTMCGVPVDLGRIDMPAYVLATQEDHIVPWKSAWRSTQLLGGETQFVLGASGHIAGVINPATKNKRCYWAGGDVNSNRASDADGWFASAQQASGTWWNHWIAWLQPHAGGRVKARTKLGNAQFRPTEPAPGRYVKTRSS
ncbi:class I poly(R)-hydroxyalkanoic acid synthase [Paraburkholderia sp. J7]|uniref:class I poly(R)-hydroxyalkanoic acid synthase n=1 Tax=Paraburkholderia sp. J7 TaxID=2805438 RepID=UPI002AB6C423|nr:class I poly(R)-hydroxyalkanoic acid synthase [Paraburkholderia sp. J7]